jgi:hypothetical protein
MAEKFTIGRRGGTPAELRNNAFVAADPAATRVGTEKGRATNTAGAGRGGQGGPTVDELRAHSVGAGRGVENPEFEKSNNSYTHESEDTGAGTIKLNEAFQSNLLDNYDAVTYHWKLFLATPEASSSGKVLDLDNQIIIAESGVTELTIDNVIIESLTTPSIDSGTGTSTIVKFEIIEPAGAALIDQIFYQSIALGIGNWNVMPFYLQLQFRARSPADSSADINGSPGPIGNLRWLWTLKLSDMKANVTTVGTKYEISAIVYNELAQSNAYFTLQHPVVLNNLSNMEDAMKKLQEILNQDQIYRLIDNVSIPDSYKIVLDDKISKYLITPSTHNTDAARNDSTIKFDGKNATFPSGTSVDKIVDTLLANTEEYQKLIKDSSTAPANGKPMIEEVNQMKKLWRIITESRPLKYDPRQNNYAREFTIFVVQYDIGVLDTNTFQDSAGAKTIEAERKRLQTYVDKRILKKKYNYIFTGLNDQVINFDIRINNAFASATARMGGIYYNAAMADKGVVNQNHSADEGAATEKLIRAISFVNSASVGEQEADEGLTIAQAKNAIDSAKLQPSDKARLTKLLNTAKAGSWTNFAEAVQAAGGLDQDRELARAQLRARAISTPVVDKTSSQGLKFISDVDINSLDAQTAYEDYVEGIKGKLRPVARIDSMQQRQTAGIESSSNSGIQKLSSIFAVAMHSTQDVSFAKVEMNIKGDPFWLFPQPVTSNDAKIFNSLKSKSEAIEFIKRGHFQVKDSVNINGTDNFIIIRFRTPRVFDTNDGVNDETNSLTDIRTFSGVFKVVTITSKFEAGKFHQILSCLMDYNIDIVNFMKEIETNIQQTDSPTSPEDLVKTNPIPVSAINGQRILGKIDIPGVESQFSIAGLGSRLGLPKGPNLGSNIPTKISSSIPGFTDLLG